MVNNYDAVVIRYGEMILKGNNKKDFIKKLANNLKVALKEHRSLVYSVEHDRIYIELNGTSPDSIRSILRTIFGISSFSFAVKVENDLEKMANKSLELVKDSNFKTFKVKAHRSYKNFPHISDEINRVIATKILKNTEIKVDVHNPDLMLLVEVREKFTYLMDNKIGGAQGFPVGSSSKVLLLLSGGIDSVVAGYLAQKRGLKLECIHFESAPYTSAQALQKVKDLAGKLSIYQNRIKLHIIPFTKMQMAINESLPESYNITVMRRMMMRIAERVALENKCLAIVNGESVGQVASQTIESMNAIGEVVKMPIIRPVVTYDKLEIINVARFIDTYKISTLPYEDCCTIFTPKNPTTRPNVEKCLRFESFFNYQDLIEECIINKVSEVIDLSDDIDLF